MLLKNVIFYDVEHKLYIFSVGGAGKVGIYVGRSLVIDVDEELGNVLPGTDVITLGT